MRRYISLWWDLFRLSCRRLPGLSAASLGVIAGSVGIVAATALSLRAAVNAGIAGDRAGAVAWAVAAAVVYAFGAVLQNLFEELVRTTIDRSGRLELHPRIHRDIATIEGIEHLERTDFLDRVTVVRASSGRLMGWMWKAIRAFAGVLRLVVTLLLLGTVSPWLLVLLVFALAPVWCDHYAQRLISRAELATAGGNRLQEHLFDVATGAASGKDLRVGGAAAAIVRRQRAAWDAMVAGQFRAHVLAAVWKFAGWVVFTLGFAGALTLVAYRTAHGQSTVGDLVLAVIVASSLWQTVQSTVSSSAQTADAARAIEPFLWLRDYVAADRERVTGTRPAPRRLGGGVVLDDVTFRYPGTDAVALDHVSLSFPAGSVVAIVGEYGSGKTTLVKLLGKFYRPDSGRILVDDVDLNDIATDAWRARFSGAFQDFGRFTTTFAETVGLGDIDHLDDRARIAAAVRAAEAEELVARLPHGLDTQLGRELGGVELSEGQWQRAALARASMRTDPLMFVLDEPTASLDAPSERAIFDRYMTYARDIGARTGAVTIIVSHRFSTVIGADHIVVLDNGRVAESGTHHELLALGGRYAELYGIHANAYATGSAG